MQLAYEVIHGRHARAIQQVFLQLQKSRVFNPHGNKPPPSPPQAIADGIPSKLKRHSTNIKYRAPLLSEKVVLAVSPDDHKPAPATQILNPCPPLLPLPRSLPLRNVEAVFLDDLRIDLSGVVLGGCR